MRRLCALAVVAVLSLGCATEGQKGQWDEFWKDLRGDNMEMRGWSTQSRPAPPKPSD